MKNFKHIVAGVILLLVVACVGAVLLGKMPNRNFLQAKRVTSAVLLLPLGSSKSQVTALLKSEDLEHSYTGDQEGIDFSSDVSANGYTSADLDGYIVAIIRDTSIGFLTSGNVQYFFFFDKKGKLLKTTVAELATGL
jgi:hypothetical protein